MQGELEEWETEALGRAREKLKADPDSAPAREVAEEFLRWKAGGERPSSFAWFMV